MPNTFALDENFDITVVAGVGTKEQPLAIDRARDRIRVILTTIKNSIILHPALGLPVVPMVRNGTEAFIRASIKRAILLQEPSAEEVTISNVVANAGIGTLDLTVSVKLLSGAAITEQVSI